MKRFLTILCVLIIALSTSVALSYGSGGGYDLSASKAWVRAWAASWLPGAETDPLSLHIDGGNAPTNTMNGGSQSWTNMGPVDATALTVNGTNVLSAAEAAQATADAAMPKTGGVFSAAVYTDRDFDTMAPTSVEIPSAGWVRSLAQTGQQWFFTTNVNAAAWAKTANFVDLSIETQSQLTNSIASPVTSDTYLAGGITTQLFGSLRSPIGFEIYLARVGGNPTTILPVHPEVYYVYNGQTNQLGDWEVASQLIDSAVPTLYNFTIPFAEPVLTASVQIVSYLKSGTVSGQAAGLNIYGGGVVPSHMDISGVAAGESFADAIHINGDNAPTATMNHGNQNLTNVNWLVVDRLYFKSGGTNSWITMDSVSNGIWRINGSNTEFNVTYGQE